MANEINAKLNNLMRRVRNYAAICLVALSSCSNNFSDYDLIRAKQERHIEQARLDEVECNFRLSRENEADNLRAEDLLKKHYDYNLIEEMKNKNKLQDLVDDISDRIVAVNCFYNKKNNENLLRIKEFNKQHITVQSKICVVREYDEYKIQSQNYQFKDFDRAKCLDNKFDRQDVSYDINDKEVSNLVNQVKIKYDHRW